MNVPCDCDYMLLFSQSSKHQKGNGSGSTSNKQGDLLDFSGFSYPEVVEVFHISSHIY